MLVKGCIERNYAPALLGLYHMCELAEANPGLKFAIREEKGEVWADCQLPGTSYTTSLQLTSTDIFAYPTESRMGYFTVSLEDGVLHISDCQVNPAEVSYLHALELERDQWDLRWMLVTTVFPFEVEGYEHDRPFCQWMCAHKGNADGDSPRCHDCILEGVCSYELDDWYGSWDEMSAAGALESIVKAIDGLIDMVKSREPWWKSTPRLEFYK